MTDHIEVRGADGREHTWVTYAPGIWWKDIEGAGWEATAAEAALLAELVKLRAEMREYANDATDARATNRELRAEAASLCEQRDKLAEAAREVWASIPASFEEGPETRRHAKALNALHGALAALDPPAPDSTPKETPR